MSTLDLELSRINGRVSKVETKYNENGQKVKVIKIKKKKRIQDDEVENEKL